jgi:hypothetical protein
MTLIDQALARPEDVFGGLEGTTEDERLVLEIDRGINCRSLQTLAKALSRARAAGIPEIEIEAAMRVGPFAPRAVRPRV